MRVLNHLVCLAFLVIWRRLYTSIFSICNSILPLFSSPICFCIHICSTINIQFEFSIRENGLLRAHTHTHSITFNYCQKITPISQTQTPCMNRTGKQYQRHKTHVILFNCNLQMELKFIRWTVSRIRNMIVCVRSGWLKRSDKNAWLSKMKIHK